MDKIADEIQEREQILHVVKKIYSSCLEGNHFTAERAWTDNTGQFAALCQDYENSHPGKGSRLFGSFQRVSEKFEDFEKVQYLLSTELIPGLYECMQDCCTFNSDIAGWRLTCSRSGCITIQDVSTGKYLCSRDDPRMEGYRKALHNYVPELDAVFICGADMGYLTEQFNEVSEGAVSIHILEADPDLAAISAEYGVLSHVPEDRCHIYCETDRLAALSSWIEAAGKYDRSRTSFIFNDGAAERFDDSIAAILRDINANEETYRDNRELCKINFVQNRKHMSGFADSEAEKFAGKDAIVIGAGPSLNDSLDFIRFNEDRAVILAVSTVAKKLLKLGITPDYIVVMDPQRRTYRHMDGVTDRNIPIIADPKAYWKFAGENEAPVFMAPNGGTPDVDEYLTGMGQKIWSARGTVTNLAMVTAMELGAENIFLAGVDLAYPGGQTHTDNTMDFGLKSNPSAVMVKNNNGGQVETSPQFMMYIKDLEQAISRHPGCRVYNLSAEGAYIAGTEPVSLI